jgi:hypothetical protein
MRPGENHAAEIVNISFISIAYSLAGAAVQLEPGSAGNSLQQGKEQGKLPISIFQSVEHSVLPSKMGLSRQISLQ